MIAWFRLNSLLILIIFFSNNLYAESNPESTHKDSEKSNSLHEVNRVIYEKKVDKAANGIEKLEALNELALYYSEWEADYSIADSLLTIAIEMAELSYDNNQLLNAYANYLLVMDDYNYSKQVLATIEKLESISIQIRNPIDIWKCKIALSKGYLLNFNMEKARDFGYQALTTANQLKSPKLIAETHLALGEVLHKMNNNVEAIRNFLDALTIAEEIQDIVLKMECYHQLSNFYNLIKAYDKAIQYKLKEINLAESEVKPDSIRIMTLKFDLEFIAFSNRTVNEKQLFKIIDFANRNQVAKLKKFGLIAFRNHLIKQNDLAQLYKLYHEEYPEELMLIRTNDTTMFYRLQSLFKEYKGEIDSAIIYLNMASLRIITSNDIIRKSSFYLRCGDFYQRNDFYSEAIDQYKASYTCASSIPYFEHMIESSNKLEKMYLSIEDYKNAYKYSIINNNISDSLDKLVQKEELQLMEIENEEVLRKQQIEKANEETRRRNNIQYTAITILIATAFLFLLILGGINVSPTLIQMVGFVAFIFFFEFLILLFDTWIHHLTHGEPWKILGIKILLMCGLLPLHHLIEKRVIHFLIQKKGPWIKRKNRKIAKVPVTEINEGVQQN